MVFKLPNPKSFTIRMTTPTELKDLQNKASLMSTGSKLDYQVSLFAYRRAGTEVSIKLLQPFHRKSEMPPVM